jgi:hypothetical protein
VARQSIAIFYLHRSISAQPLRRFATANAAPPLPPTLANLRTDEAVASMKAHALALVNSKVCSKSLIK